VSLAPSYQDFLRTLEALMREAHGLELYRTSARLHSALDTARAEVYEVIPSPAPRGSVDFVVGPIREQATGT
jgi:hypothetical protein